MSKEFLPKTQHSNNRYESTSESAQFKDNRAETNSIRQRQALDEDEPMQGQFETVQKMDLEEEEPLQGKFELASQEAVTQKQENDTGIPDNLKNGMENLSGYSLDHVKVHYNSSKPAGVQAHAYAQGSDIHLASGQEKHLPHELGHVVQQMEGRVQPTTSVGGMQVNDDQSLEQEATVMGAKALVSAEQNLLGGKI